MFKFIYLFYLSFITILAESNRVPFDLPESESELVAGFLTDYSSIYFSVILLTEYANLLNIEFVFIILFFLSSITLLLFLFFICISRSLFIRFRFDLSISYL